MNHCHTFSTSIYLNGSHIFTNTKQKHITPAIGSNQSPPWGASKHRLRLGSPPARPFDLPGEARVYITQWPKANIRSTRLVRRRCARISSGQPRRHASLYINQQVRRIRTSVFAWGRLIQIPIRLGSLAIDLSGPSLSDAFVAFFVVFAVSYVLSIVMDGHSTVFY